MSLRAVAPDVAADWHPHKNGSLTAWNVVPGSAHSVWWKCQTCGYEWRTKVENRTRRKRGCAACGNKIVTATNSLAARNPKLAAEWHPTKNGSLTARSVVPGSDKRVWWRCSLSPWHEWATPVHKRAGKRRGGCPFCSGHRGKQIALSV